MSNGKRKDAPTGSDSSRTPKRGTSSESDEVEAALVRCGKCGHEVPKTNLALHEISCRKENNHSSIPRPAGDLNRPEADNRAQVMQAPQPEEIPTASHTNGEPEQTPAASYTNGEQPAELMDVEPPSTLTGPRLSEPTVGANQREPSVAQSSGGEQWSCPRCTLINPATSMRCDACLLAAPGVVHHPIRRSPVAVGPSQPPSPPQFHMEVREINPQTVDTVNNVVSYSLIGAFFGGGVGALVGAAGGAIISGITRWNNHRADRAVAEGQPPRAQRAQQPHGRITVIRSNGSVGHAHQIDPLVMQMLMMSALAQGTQNANQLSYEELLQRFGVGTENRGASQETIDAVPLKSVGNVEELKDNEKTCNICLEDFREGDEIRKLSCSHGFHKNCGDRWLKQVASCPICKAPIEPNGSGADQMRAASQPT